MLCLCTVNIYEMTGEQINKLMASQTNPKHLHDWLPYYCLKEDGMLDITTNYLQYVFSPDEKYFLLDIINIEHPLLNEFEGCGLTEFRFDYSFIKKLPNVRNLDDIRSYRPSDHLLYEIEYHSSYSPETGTEYDSEVYLVGYLDERKNKIYFDDEAMKQFEEKLNESPLN